MENQRQPLVRHMETDVANHILPTSAILLGICFVVFGAVRAFGREELTSLDEYALIGIFVFLAASLLSFLSFVPRMRKVAFEQAANFVLMLGLVFLTLTSIFVSREVIS